MRDFFHTGLNVSRSDVAFAVNGVNKHLFVSSNLGRRGNDAKSKGQAVSTIQTAVEIANSPDNCLENIDIHILGGQYVENVHFSREGSNLDYLAMLWAEGGKNAGRIGTIRLIAHGYVWLNTSVISQQPAISICRPNIEIHDFMTIKIDPEVGGYPITAGNWTFANGDTNGHVKMPVIGISDNFNNSDLLHGAANNVLISGCKINGGTGAGGILNDGGNWIRVENCKIEYYHDYGVAHIGSEKGHCAENLIYGCDFAGPQYSGAAVLHDNLVYSLIDRCIFRDPDGNSVLALLSGGTVAIECLISNCQVHDEADLVSAAPASNIGFDAVNITTVSGGGPGGNDDLAAGSWVDTDNFA